MADHKDKNHQTGAVSSLLAQDQAYKDKQAPKINIPGFGSKPDPDVSVRTDKVESEPEKVEVSVRTDKPIKTEKPAKATRTFTVRMIPAGKIEPWAYTNRPESEFGDWDSFVESISKNGVEVPIIVRPAPKAKDRYEVIAGRRRWKACLELGIDVPADIRDLTDREAAVIQELENDERSDVSDWADALNYKRLLDNGVFKNQTALAVTLNIDRRRINDLMAYTRIDDRIIAAIGHLSNVSKNNALILASIPDADVKKVLPIIEKEAEAIREGKVAKRKLTELLSVRTDNPATTIIKVKGVESHSIRRDTNGTAVISLRKPLLQYVSAEEISEAISKLHQEKMKSDNQQ